MKLSLYYVMDIHALRKLNLNRGYTGADPDFAKYACAKVRFHICDAMSIPA